MLGRNIKTEGDGSALEIKTPVSLMHGPSLMRISCMITAAGWLFLTLALPVNAQQVTMDMLRTRIRQLETCLTTALGVDTVKIVIEDVRQNGAVTIVSSSFSKKESFAGKLFYALGTAIENKMLGEKRTIYNSDFADFEETRQMSMEMSGSVVLGEFNITYVVLSTPRHQYDTRRPEYFYTRSVAKCL